ncbi:MAG: hypothetical protein QXG65_04155, partial [Thermoplasmata archaeon]
ITEPADQVHAVLDIEYGRGEEFHVEIRDHVVTIRAPDRAKFDPAWFAAKPRVVDRIRTRLSPKAVRFVEEYVTPVPEKAPEGAATPAVAAEGAAPSTTERTNPI